MTAQKVEMASTSSEEPCDYSGLPPWLCPHCPEFRRATPQPLGQPGAEPLAQVVRLDGPDTSSRKWTGLSREAKPRPIRVVCDHEAAGFVLCPVCQRDLAAVLSDVPALLRDLDLAITKAVNFVERGSRLGDSTDKGSPLPWDDRAAKARARLVAELAEAAQAMGLPLRGGPAGRARRLRSTLPRMARREDGADLASRLSYAVAEAHHAIDLPPSPWYYGPCPGCHRDLYLERLSDDDPDARVVCPEPDCDYSATLAEHRLAQLDAGDDRLLTVGELVGAITSAGEPVTRDQINGWIRREGLYRERRVLPRLGQGGRLTHSTVWVYRLGDVRRLAVEADRRRAG